MNYSVNFIELKLDLFLKPIFADQKTYVSQMREVFRTLEFSSDLGFYESLSQQNLFGDKIRNRSDSWTEGNMGRRYLTIFYVGKLRRSQYEDGLG